MGLISQNLAEVPAIVIIAMALCHTLALLGREVRLAMLTWLALRGTQPSERPEILRALVGSPVKGQIDSTK
jgi:hypothetical protein